MEAISAVVSIAGQPFPKLPVWFCLMMKRALFFATEHQNMESMDRVA